jgi:hypothetical protein
MIPIIKNQGNEMFIHLIKPYIVEHFLYKLGHMLNLVNRNK